MQGNRTEVDEAAIDPLTFGRALLAANAVDPGEFPDRMREELLAQTSAIDLELHLIDYQLRSLRPIGPAGTADLRRPVPVPGSRLGDSFRLQQVTADDAPAGQLRHVPVSVRGQRLGVLTGTFAQPPTETDVRTLRAIALAVAHTVLETSAGTDIYEIGRRHGRMSVAAEMQWQLLPARAYQTRHFYVAGHLEPALRVAGDAFEFAVNDDVLTLAVLDAASSGAMPSLITTLAVTAIRHARRAELPLAEQAALVSDIIWQHTHGAQHISALFLELNARTGHAATVEAGSPALIRRRDERAAALQLEPQTPLGMFDDTRYDAQLVDLRPGDRAYAFSDGAFTGNHSLSHVTDILASDTGAHLPPESIRQVIAELTYDGREPEDDITVVCVDWTR